MHLAYQEFGSGSPPLLLLHGMFGSGRNWRGVVDKLGARRVLTPDLRGHGASPAEPPMTVEAMAADVYDLLLELGLGKSDVVGHSLGGKVAMALALAHPHVVRRLVVADIAPRRYGGSNTAILTALLAVDPGLHPNRGSVDRALAAAGIENERVRAFLLTNLRQREDGLLYWQPGIPAMASADADLDWAPATDAGTFSGPTLLLRGSLSGYVQAGDLERMRTWFPAATEQVLTGAGHWLHADQPQAFAAAVRSFLDG